MAPLRSQGKNLFKLKPKSLLLVSDGKYTRDELVDLAIQLSKKFKDSFITNLDLKSTRNWLLNYPKNSLKFQILMLSTMMILISTTI